MISNPASADSKKAAAEALNGVDPTNGAMYFFDNRAPTKWLCAQPIAMRSGNMIFAY